MSPSELRPSAPCMLQRAFSYSCISSSSFGTVTLETAPNPYQNTRFFSYFLLQMVLLGRPGACFVSVLTLLTFLRVVTGVFFSVLKRETAALTWLQC